jgi:hypothetical protein
MITVTLSRSDASSVKVHFMGADDVRPFLVMRFGEDISVIQSATGHEAVAFARALAAQLLTAADEIEKGLALGQTITG